MRAVAAAKIAPQKPEPSASRNAMNATPVAIGCRIITRVRPLVVSVEAEPKSVLSNDSMTSAGLYPMCFPVQPPLAPDTQYPKVPKLTVLSPVLSWTFKRAMSFTTGEVMVVMRRRMEATNKRNVPMWWKMPVFAILMFVLQTDTIQRSDCS